jgi:RHS repeat-associated protein
LNGNLLKDAAVWDARDRLISLTSNGITSTFTYDALDRRTSKTTNGQTEAYLYDGSDIISENGAVNSVYTYGSGVDEPLIRKSSQYEYYLADHLGSVIGLTDINGNLLTSYNYSAYGIKQTTGTTSTNPFAFTGREDDGNGYYFYRARYYSPDLKRFTAEDPAGFGGGNSNLYSYVGGNPISGSDPSGLRTYVTPGFNGDAGTLKKNITSMGGAGDSPAKDSVVELNSPSGLRQNPPFNGFGEEDIKVQIMLDLRQHPLERDEPVNLVAFSNGNLFSAAAVEYLRKVLPSNTQINVARLDSAGTNKPTACKVVDIGSNNPNSSDLRDRLGALNPADYRADPGVGHEGLANNLNVIRTLRDKFNFKF